MDGDADPKSAQIAGQRLGAFDSPIDEPDLGNPQLGQRRRHRTGRAAGPEHDRRARTPDPNPGRNP